MGSEEDDPRNLITGEWNVLEDSPTFGKQSYTLVIEKDHIYADRINMLNFYNLGMQFSVYATLNNLEITIPVQTVDDNIIGGNGTIGSNYQGINLIYSVDFGSGSETVKADLSRNTIAGNKINLVLTE